MKTYQIMKDQIKSVSDDRLMALYHATMISEDSSVEEITVHTALEAEAEDRGLIVFDEDEFEFVEA